MNKILEERTKQLEKLKAYLLNDLSFLDISCIKIFGSATNTELFDCRNSDIDIIAYTNKIKYQNVEEIVKTIEILGGDFIDKQPIFIKDFINARVEYFYKIDDIAFDINIFPNKVWGYENISNTVLHDALDIFFGGMNQYAETIHGVFMPLEEIKTEVYPFYNDEIRERRLKILEQRISAITQKIKTKILNKDMDVFEYILKNRTYIIKWLFINNKIYPLDTYKHLNYQLSNMLHLDKKDIDALLLMNSNNINEIIEKHLDFIDRKVLVKKR